MSQQSKIQAREMRKSRVKVTCEEDEGRDQVVLDVEADVDEGGDEVVEDYVYFVES